MSAASQIESRSSLRDGRRSKTDDTHTATAGAKITPRRSRSRRLPPYANAPFLDHPLTVSDLVPRNLWSLGKLAALGLFLILAVLMLCRWWSGGEPATGEKIPAAFDLSAEGNLADALTAAFFLLSAGAAAFVFSLRRHRQDDHRGRYRIWCWAAVCWLLVATDEMTSLHEALQAAMIRVSGTRLGGDGALWWIAAYLFLLGGVGARLLVDARRSTTATLLLLLGYACFGIDAAVRLQQIPVATERTAVALAQASEMVGGLFVLLATLRYARYVLCEAHGLLPAGKPRATAATARRRSDLDSPASADASTKPGGGAADDATDAEADDDDRRSSTRSLGGVNAVHASHALRAPYAAASAASVRTASGSSAAPASSEDDGSTDDENRSKLSKADRKALKKRLLDERTKREQQQRSQWK